MAINTAEQSNGKLILGYIRVSSLDQVRDQESLPRQEEKIRSYCKLKELDEPMIIADEGVSGYKDNRQGFQQLIELCKQNRVKTLIIYDLSRLSRSVRTTLSFIEDLIQKQGIEFVSLCQNIETNTPHGKAFLTLISVFNQLYRDEIAYKTRLALHHKKMKGEKYSGKIPYGFTATEDGLLVHNEIEVDLMTRIYELRLSGLSLRNIALALEADGVKTKSGNTKWSPQVIKDLVKRGVRNGS